MAQFKATITPGHGQQTTTSRLGHKSGGIVTTCNGWNAGVTVLAEHTDDDRDVFVVLANGGSNGQHRGEPVARITDVDGCRVVEVFDPNVGDFRPLDLPESVNA